MRVHAPALAVCALFIGHAAAFWRLPCRNSLTIGRLDPIISPGSVSSHVHTVFGGSGFSDKSTYNDMRASQCSSCDVNEDLSAYWVPSLYMAFANGTFAHVPMTGGGLLVYYLQRRSTDSQPLVAPPAGFRMVSGTPSLRSYNASSLAQQAVSFVCLDYPRGGGVPQSPNLPTQGCSAGLRAQVFFPSCWDGKNLDSSDHKSHVAFPSTMDNGVCPSTHPVRLISLFYEVRVSSFGGADHQVTFDTWSMEGLRSQALNTSQPFVFANGDPLGYGYHGDFLNGWDVNVLQNAVSNCNASSGVIEECPYFSYFPSDSQCRSTPIFNETVTGTLLSKLPGCNPITSGPGAASMCADPSPPSRIAGAPVAYQGAVPPVGVGLPPYFAPTVPLNVTSGGAKWNYAGCFAEIANGRLLPNSLIDAAGGSGSMTPQRCIAACQAGSYAFCGLEYGQECWAGNALNATAVSDSQCGMPCTGDQFSICGDSSRLTVYTPATSAAASSTTSAAPAPTASASPAASLGPYTAQGCWVDSGSSRALSNRLAANSNMTAAICAGLAKAGSYNFFGTEYGSECWAGQSLGGSAADVSTCNMACSGDASSKCGGSNRLSLYAAKPALFSTNPGPAGSTFVGCYVEQSPRVLPTGVPFTTPTVANCVSACQSRGYAYAGAEYAGECYCANSLPSSAAIAAPASDPIAAGCSMSCKGNTTEACGGPSRISVYRLPVAASAKQAIKKGGKRARTAVHLL